MLLQTVLAVCLVSVVLGDGCCTPEQWEGTEYVAGGFAKGFRRGGFSNGFNVSYDAKAQSVAVSGMYRRRGQEGEFKVIYNFAQSKGYFILPKKSMCKTYDLKRPFREACIPDGAEELGETYFGAGTNILNVKAYAMRYVSNSSRTYIGAVALVTQEGCIPVSEDVSGVYRRVAFFENVNFAGITPGIEDPAVFTPPEFCDQETVVDMVDEEFYEKYSMLQFTHPGVASDPSDRAFDEEEMTKLRHPVF